MKLRAVVNGNIVEVADVDAAKILVDAGIYELVERSEAQDEPAAQQTDAPAVQPRKRGRPRKTA